MDAPVNDYGENSGDAGDAGNGSSSKNASKDVAYYKEQLRNEKAGKRKLYHSLVKLADELKKLRSTSKSLQEQAEYANQTWYEGGIWRPPQLLPGVDQDNTGTMLPAQRSRVRQAVSLSDLFFNLVIVTAFTRVGVAITNSGQVTGESILYFAVFWTIWSKEASYSTRFDTTDLSSKVITLLNCFAVLFASLSVSSNIQTEGANRIMIMSAFCSMLHFVLMARVFSFYRIAEPNSVDQHVQTYALFNCIMNLVESATWIFGMIFTPLEYRYIVFTVGVLLGLRIPRAFLANDFHGKHSEKPRTSKGTVTKQIFPIATDVFPSLQLPTQNEVFFSFFCLGSCCKASLWWLQISLSMRHPIGDNTLLLAPRVFSCSVSRCYMWTTPTFWPPITPCL
jgi:hypothetical protein